MPDANGVVRGIVPKEYTVTLIHGAGSYPIHVRAGLLADVGPRTTAMGFTGKALLLTNPTVAEHHLGRVERSLRNAGMEPIVFHMPDGEEFKSIPIANAVWGKALEAGLDRRSPVIALGGGVVCDMAGFIAATYMRGIPFIQVPTTLLSQVDASVGGKVAVNIPGGKNVVGAFHQPRAVLIDPLTLATLDDRDIRSGYAEIIKHGVALDAKLLEKLEGLDAGVFRDPEAMSLLISENVAIKARIVGEDETEQGPRALLNFGHTLAHALESATGYRALRHGEAIAIGMAFAAGLSAATGRIPETLASRVVRLISGAGLPTDMGGLTEPVTVDGLVSLMTKDKKAENGSIRFVLLDGPGVSSYGVGVPDGIIRQLLADMGAVI